MHHPDPYGRGPLRTPAQWCTIYDIHVIDPLGWRGPDARPYSDVISLPEFWRRLCASNIRSLPPETQVQLQRDLRTQYSVAERGVQPQPDPAPSAHPQIADLVIAEINLRREQGIRTYGTPLQPHNGRDAVQDALEEALDLAHYLVQMRHERDHPVDLSQFRAEVHGDPHRLDDRWVAVRHRPCDQFVFGDGRDDADWVDMSDLMPRILAHVCPPEEP